MSNISRGLQGNQLAIWNHMSTNYTKARADLGAKIRAIRIRDSVSQEDLAYKAKIERSYMGKIERGESNPSFKKIVDIANALNVPLKDLIY